MIERHVAYQHDGQYGQDHYQSQPQYTNDYAAHANPQYPQYGSQDQQYAQYSQEQYQQYGGVGAHGQHATYGAYGASQNQQQQYTFSPGEVVPTAQAPSSLDNPFSPSADGHDQTRGGPSPPLSRQPTQTGGAPPSYQGSPYVEVSRDVKVAPVGMSAVSSTEPNSKKRPESAHTTVYNPDDAYGGF
ncbi:hypothetical protein BD779DRAFT_516944 [Infundibulicybe gibba]|nr:hypothetical protein BD779DRAFT_516944 [Infundibulicybe gibba]